MSALPPIATLIAYLHESVLRHVLHWNVSALGVLGRCCRLSYLPPMSRRKSWYWAANAYIGSPSFLGLYQRHGIAYLRARQATQCACCFHPSLPANRRGGAVMSRSIRSCAIAARTHSTAPIP